MTFPKLVVHAAQAGLYGGFIVALFLRLANPAGSHDGRGPALAAIVVVLAYTLAAATVWPVLYAGLRFFASHRLRLGWLSLRYLIGFHAVNTAALLGAGWTMLSKSRWALAPRDLDRLARACAFLTVAWLVSALVATLPVLRRWIGLQAAAGVLALAALVMSFRGVPVPPAGSIAAGPPPAPWEMLELQPAIPPLEAGAVSSSPPGPISPAAGRRLVLLNFDGADLDTILTMQAQGKLPGFARLVQEGAYGRLASIGPCVASVTRATLVTGMLPHRHGVRSALARTVLGGPRIDIVPPGIGFDLLLSPFLERRGTSVADRRTLALWEISGRQGGLGEAAGWDIDLDTPRSRASDDSFSAAPQEWMNDLLDPEALRQRDPKGRALVREIVRAAAADATVLAALQRFETREGRGVLAVSFPGLDRVAHVFLRYARPSDFGNVSARDIDLYGPVLERYYRRIDDILGGALQAGGGRTLVLVTATHGIEPAPALRRLRDEIMGGEHLSGVHDDAPAGFLFAHGSDVAHGRVFGKGSIADVTPTALYALGLPVARDARGSILAGAFSEAYTASHPVTVIESYDTGR